MDLLSTGFEGITQMILEQKRLMEQLEVENRELRRQLTDLRRGVGLALLIDGKTIPLASEQSTAPTNRLPPVSQQQSFLKTAENPLLAVRDTESQRMISGQLSQDRDIEQLWRNSTSSPLAESFVL